MEDSETDKSTCVSVNNSMNYFYRNYSATISLNNKVKENDILHYSRVSKYSITDILLYCEAK